MAVPVAAVAAFAKKKVIIWLIKKGIPILLALILVFSFIMMFLLVSIMTLLTGGSASASSCNEQLTIQATNGPINVGDKIEDPMGGLRTFTEDMMLNAQLIVKAGLEYRDRETGEAYVIPTQGLVIALATAIPESGLINSDEMRDHDSIGLFQQRVKYRTVYGTPEQIMDPIYSSTTFYSQMLAIENWQTKEPGEVAADIQRPAARYRYKYSLYMPMAAGLVQSILPALEANNAMPANFESANQNCEPGTGEPGEYGEATPEGSEPGPNGTIIQIANVPGIGKMNATAAPAATAMLDAARTEGLNLTGSSYRSHQQQIQVRIKNCGGSSHYNIWEKRSGNCRPPTAIPGTSQHEYGLAIDFRNCSTRSTACYQWLNRNAEKFGFFNLPSEPWHWSTTGR